MRLFRAWAPVVAAAVILAAAGCGSSAPTKAGPSEQEKQQLRELDAQRQSEWGKKPKR